MADELIVNANVDETDLQYISLGQKVEMYLDSYPDIKFQGQIEHIAYEATVISNVTVYIIKIRPINPPKMFRSGMTATITVVIESKKDVWALPVEFIHVQGHQSFVFVFKGNEKLKLPRKIKDKDIELREVQTGVEDGRFIEITEGLNEDETVVILSMPENAPQGVINRGLGGRRRR
jgi:macrolide-specific efflux system membrane fusion protein